MDQKIWYFQHLLQIRMEAKSENIKFFFIFSIPFKLKSLIKHFTTHAINLLSCTFEVFFSGNLANSS